MKKYIQLRDYAKNYLVTYRTAWNSFNSGKIPLKMLIILDEYPKDAKNL